MKLKKPFLRLGVVGAVFWCFLFNGFLKGSALVTPLVTLDASQLSLGKTLEVTITLIQEARPVATPILISRSFQTLAPPIRKSKLLLEKGKVTKQLRFIYRLKAIRLGSALLSVKVGRRLVGTYSVQITAQKGAAEQKKLVLLAENVVNKKHFFIHEPFVVETKLYFDRDFTRIKLLRAFEHKKLHLQKLVSKGSGVGRARRNGKAYKTYVFLKQLAYPLAAGKVILSKGVLEVETSPTLSGVPIVMEVPIPPLTLVVKQYPKTGAPPSFKNNFGTFTLTAQLPTTPLRVKQVSKIALVVTGIGNFQALVFPQLKLQPAQPEVLLSGEQENDFSLQRESFVGKAVMPFYLLPNKAGLLTWAPLHFSFYSPTKKTYVTQRLTLPALPVLQNASSPTEVETAVKKPLLKPKLLAVSATNASTSFLSSTKTKLKAALEAYSVIATLALHGMGLFLISLFFWWDKKYPPLPKNQTEKMLRKIKECLQSWEKKPPQLEKRRELLELLELLHWVNNSCLAKPGQTEAADANMFWKDEEKKAAAATLKPLVQKQLERLEKWLYSPPQTKEYFSRAEAKKLSQQSVSLVKKTLNLV